MSYQWSPGWGVLDYTDLLAQANLQNCSPRDSECVANNVAKQAAVEDFWVQHMATGVPDDTRLTFAPLSSSAVREFYDPSNPFFGGNVVDTRGVMYVSSPDLPPAQLPPAVVEQSKPAPPKPAGSPSDSSLHPPAFTLPTVAGFDLSSVPWWGWAAVVGVGVFAMRGSR